jgi:hypothetical protein
MAISKNKIKYLRDNIFIPYTLFTYLLSKKSSWIVAIQITNKQKDNKRNLLYNYTCNLYMVIGLLSSVLVTVE